MAASHNSSTTTSIDGTSRDGRSWKDLGKTSITELRNGRPKPQGSLWSRWVAKAREENRGNWKPLSLTMPILLATLLATLLIVATIELLAQTSQARGGFALSNSIDEIPQYAMIAYQYAPQVIAVLYSIVWSWIDLDVKRMQPWFELSKESGSSAEDSLMLDYPFTFMAFVPFQAAKRKHWMVFLSGTTMMIVFWAITPLQASHLDVDKVSITETREIVSRSQLLPVADQLDLLGPEILNNGYAVAWLNQSYPPFTTPQEAFLPFYVDGAELPIESEQNWTATTTRFSTELSCWSADISHHDGASQETWDFLNGHGCNVSVPIPYSGNYSMLYMGYRPSPYSSYALESPQCPPTENSTHQFLAIWARTIHLPDGLSYKYDLTGAFCQTDYFKQPVVLTVDAERRRPDQAAVEAVGPRERLLDSEFNRTAFEFLLGNGMPEQVPEKDIPFRIVLDQHHKLLGRNLTVPVSNMVGYALASQDWHAREYSGLETLQQVYEEAHKYLFSLAINRLLVNDTEVSNHTATATFNMVGIVVSRTISAVLEALLLLVAVFIAVVIWMVSRASSSLDVNPSSISRIAEIFGNSPQLLDSLCSVDNADEKSLLEAVSNDRFRLTWNSDRQHVEVTRENGSVIGQDRQTDVPRGYYEPVRPMALRRGTGVAFVAAVTAAIAGLAYLKWAEIKFTGLQHPSPNTDARQILESYIPTMLSTMVEPFWVLVNRLLCVLQPFNDLWKGGAKASNSISATYTSVPPQFAAWRALKSRHYTLVLVCGAVFLSNILTVSFPAIFEDKEVLASYPQNFRPEISTTFNNESVFGLSDFLNSNKITTTSYHDPSHSALANITGGASLLPWVSQDYFFQPWDLDNGSRTGKADSYSFFTRGYGAKPQCVSIEPAVFPVEAVADPILDSDPPYCGDSLAIARASILENEGTDSTGPSAIEYINTPTGGEFRFCDKTLTFGWARAERRKNHNSTTVGSFAVCQPVFETAMFKVEVDTLGHVLAYEKFGKLQNTLDYPDSQVHIDQLIAQVNFFIGTLHGWHNDTLSRDWINHLIVELNDSRSHLDPLGAVPDPDELLPFVEDIYGRLFANFLALNRQLFDKPDSDRFTEGSRFVRETRLFMDDTAFITTVVMLGINIAIAAVFYTHGAVFVLPRMPTSLGSILAYIAPSRFATELDAGVWDENDVRFSFGRFIGRDGLSHIGVETDTHVIPIDPASLGGGSRRRRRVFGRHKSQQLLRDSNWL